jgi:hypothetical protein
MLAHAGWASIGIILFGVIDRDVSAAAALGTQFTCFTGTKLLQKYE